MRRKEEIRKTIFNELLNKKLDKCYVIVHVVTVKMPIKKNNNITNVIVYILYGVDIRGQKTVLGRGITDNGCEFLNFNGLEKSIQSTDEELIKRFKIHYADPYASYQKALVENNHRIIRYMIEKGYDMSNLTKEELLNIMNRVNDYPRKCLGYSTPYLEMIKVIDENILKQLGFYYIPIDELNMKSKRVA